MKKKEFKIQGANHEERKDTYGIVEESGIWLNPADGGTFYEKDRKYKRNESLGYYAPNDGSEDHNRTINFIDYIRRNGTEIRIVKERIPGKVPDMPNPPGIKGYAFKIYRAKFGGVYGGLGTNRIAIKEVEYIRPNPTYPHYQATKHYFSNQLVATFSNLHQTIAELPENGTINGKTTPNLTLMRNGNEEGKIIYLRPVNPNIGEVAIVKKDGNYIDFYRLKSTVPFQRPREKPYTEVDKEVILNAIKGEGTHLLKYHLRLKLHNFLDDLPPSGSSDDTAPWKIKERIKGLHTLFSNKTITEEVIDYIPEKGKTIEKVTGRRYLSILNSGRPQENKMVEVILPIVPENREDIFTIKKQGLKEEKKPS